MKKFLVGLLAALACFAMVACVPGDLAKAEEKMEKAGYNVASYELSAEGYVGGIAASLKSDNPLGDLGNALGGKTMNAVLFETADDAKAYAEGKENVEVSGKWVFWRNEDAIKAFKK